MVKVKHFKGGVYTVTMHTEDFVYYGDLEKGQFWKRKKNQFLSKDNRSETGNRLDYYDYSENEEASMVEYCLDNYVDVTDYDKSVPDEAQNKVLEGILDTYVIKLKTN